MIILTSQTFPQIHKEPENFKHISHPLLSACVFSFITILILILYQDIIKDDIHIRDYILCAMRSPTGLVVCGLALMCVYGVYKIFFSFAGVWLVSLHTSRPIGCIRCSLAPRSGCCAVLLSHHIAKKNKKFYCNTICSKAYYWLPNECQLNLRILSAAGAAFVFVWRKV